KKGDFEQLGISELETQKQAILNFFMALKQKYQKQWTREENAFQYASGFRGAMDFFRLKMIPYCNLRKSFQMEVMEKVINLDRDNLILQEEIKGLGGKKGAKTIYEMLVDVFNQKTTESDDWKI
ncbi:MAG: hypothetical protein GY862_21250, partial [Gammaproteobacteria bacterium]|nr:hypothetical protein [Gammaproteobacteria bacterium]